MGLLKFFFSSDGRISRSQYWFGTVAALLVALAGYNVLEIAYLLYYLGAFVMLLAITALSFLWVKRLHDLGRSGWWALLLLPFPYLNLAAGLFWLGFIPGVAKENEYGVDPQSQLHSKEGGVLFKMKKAGE